jgi:hypothetical protein
MMVCVPQDMAVQSLIGCLYRHYLSWESVVTLDATASAN